MKPYEDHVLGTVEGSPLPSEPEPEPATIPILQPGVGLATSGGAVAPATIAIPISSFSSAISPSSGLSPSEAYLAHTVRPGPDPGPGGDPEEDDPEMAIIDWLRKNKAFEKVAGFHQGVVDVRGSLYSKFVVWLQWVKQLVVKLKDGESPGDYPPTGFIPASATNVSATPHGNPTVEKNPDGSTSAVIRTWKLKFDLDLSWILIHNTVVMVIRYEYPAAGGEKGRGGQDAMGESYRRGAGWEAKISPSSDSFLAGSTIRFYSERQAGNFFEDFALSLGNVAFDLLGWHPLARPQRMVELKFGVEPIPALPHDMDAYQSMNELRALNQKMRYAQPRNPGNPPPRPRIR